MTRYWFSGACMSGACLLVSSLLMHAATPGIQNKLRLAPLSFETAADGSLVAHQGPCVLTLEAGRTTVTLTDRGHRRSATVSTRLAGASTGSRPIGENPLAAK